MFWLPGRRSQELFSSMCRRVGNTLTCQEEWGTSGESRLSDWSRTCNCWKTMQWTLFPSPTMPVRVASGESSWKGENSDIFCLSEEPLPRKLRMGLADWPSWVSHYAEHSSGIVYQKPMFIVEKWTRAQLILPNEARGDWGWLPGIDYLAAHQGRDAIHEDGVVLWGLLRLGGCIDLRLCRDWRNEEALLALSMSIGTIKEREALAPS